MGVQQRWMWAGALGLALAGLPRTGAGAGPGFQLGREALCIAVNSGDAPAALALIKAGADVHMPFSDGTPLLNEASGSGNLAMLKVLRQSGAGLEEAGPERFTPLMAAARRGRLEAAGLLMDWGADRDAVDRRGMTALDYAAAEGYPDVVDAIVERGVARVQPRSRPRDDEAGEAPDASQAWMLSTFALWDQLSDDYCLCLGGDRRNQKMGTAEFLTKWWGIHSRAEALAQLKRMSDTEWNNDFMAKRDQVARWGILELVFHILIEGQNSQETRKILIARRNQERLGQRGILAWDLARYLWFASHAYGAGYLGKEEAWGMMLPVACRLQDAFPSWKACQDSYLVGREYSSTNDSDQERLRNTETFLLDPKNLSSPWNLHPWNQDLGCAAPNPGAKP